PLPADPIAFQARRGPRDRKGPGKTPRRACAAMAELAAAAIIGFPLEKRRRPMANVPGVVTDPGRIKGGVIALPSGGTQIAAYLAQPNAPGNYPGIVVIQEAFGLVDHIR